jgi:hypothetical protein
MVLNMIEYRDKLINLLPQTCSIGVEYSPFTHHEGDGKDVGEVGGGTRRGSGDVSHQLLSVADFSLFRVLYCGVVTSKFAKLGLI